MHILSLVRGCVFISAKKLMPNKLLNYANLYKSISEIF